MEHEGGDKYVASHLARCSLLVWVQCLVRYFISSPVKLDTDTSPSVSVLWVQATIATTIGTLLSLGLLFLVFTSFVAAFVSGCPFHSALSSFIRFIFKKLQTLSRRIPCRCLSPKRLRLRYLWIGTLTFLWVASVALVAFYSLVSPTYFPLLSLLAGIPIAYSTQHEAAHKPQKYRIPILATLVFVSVSLSMIFAMCFFPFENTIYIPPYIIAMLVAISACWMLSKMSKSMAGTGEIDAIAWLLTTTPQYPATFFKKAAQMTGIDSIGRHYRPRLLESLLPLLTPLITSHHAPEHHSSDTDSPQSDDVLNRRPRANLNPMSDDMVPIDSDRHLKNLEIYIACLAQLSDFTDSKGTFWCLREDAKQHPKLERPLIDKLVEFVNPQCHFQDGLRSAATKVLNNYQLDMEGNPLESSTTGTTLESVATDPRSDATMLNVNRWNSQDQGHSELCRRVERVMHEDLTTRVEPATHVGPASTTTSIDDSQEQGLAKLYMPVDPDTWVEPEESEIEQVMPERELADSGM